MRQIKVNDKCSGCGLCIVNSSYLQEDDEGNAKPVQGLVIKDEDMEQLNKVINECPEHAIELLETGTATKTGKAGIMEVIADLKKKCENFSVKKVKEEDVKLDVNKYSIPIPYSDKEYKREYTSESAVRSAAKDEFNRLCFSESAYRPMIKKVFVEYKVDVLKPYYVSRDEPDSAYYPYNEQIRKYLAEAYAEICHLAGEGTVSESWKNFSVYIREKESCIRFIQEFDERSTSSGIISALEKYDYFKLNKYASRISIDFDKTYVGEGLFGKAKYKDMWYFEDFGTVAKEYVEDITWAIDYMSIDIEGVAARLVNSAFEEFEKEIKKEFASKIKELEDCVK